MKLIAESPAQDPDGAPASDNGALESTPGYIRGGSGVPTDTRHVLRIALGTVFAALGVLAIVLTVAAAHHNSRHLRLQQHGAGVQVTVTSCVGTASGTGITNNGFTCRGSFSLNGHRYNDVIAGSDQLRAPGGTLAGVTDPAAPGILWTAQAVSATSASWSAYLTPAILAGLILLAGGFALWRSRRRGAAARLLR